MERETFPKLEDPVALTADEVSVVPAALAPEQGRESVVRAIRSGVLRPFDIVNVDAEDIRLLFVPFWRIVASIEGALEPARVRSERGGPLGAIAVARHEDAVVVVCARRSFPYEPRLTSLFGRLSGAPVLEIDPDAMIAYDAAAGELARGEIVEPDLDRAHAEGIATGMLFRAWRLDAALSATIEPRVETARFCLYPLYFARYTYSGEARRRPREELFVAVSGRTGEVVAATHPSAARSVAAKVRRLLSLDRRL